MKWWKKWMWMGREIVLGDQRVKPKFGWKLYSKHGDGKIGVDP